MGLFEKVFVDSVDKIKKRSSERSQKKSGMFPGIKNKDKSMMSDKDVSNSRVLKGNNESLSTEMSILSDMDMNELDKRLIMEDFLSNEEVKREIFKMLFEEKEGSEGEKGIASSTL